MHYYSIRKQTSPSRSKDDWIISFCLGSVLISDDVTNWTRPRRSRNI